MSFALSLRRVGYSATRAVRSFATSAEVSMKATLMKWYLSLEHHNRHSLSPYPLLSNTVTVPLQLTSSTDIVPNNCHGGTYMRESPLCNTTIFTL
jgi:hypothetical protein